MKKITYILYKLEDITQDIKYLYEFKSQEEIKHYIKENYNLNNVKDYITKDLEHLKPLKNNIVIFKDSI
jgi:hypothetical protein